MTAAYADWLKGWWSKDGIADILRILAKNKTARRVVFSNLLNPTVRKLILKGANVFEPPKGQGQTSRRTLPELGIWVF